MSDHDHHHDTAPVRRILGIRLGKKPKPDPLTLGGGTKVGCCGTCVGAPRPGLPAKPVR